MINLGKSVMALTKPHCWAQSNCITLKMANARIQQAQKIRHKKRKGRCMFNVLIGSFEMWV